MSKKNQHWKKGDKIKVVKQGRRLGWEDIDESKQACLEMGQVCTIEKYDGRDHSVMVEESVCDTWISGMHFDKMG